jgi:hypothetical protein
VCINGDVCSFLNNGAMKFATNMMKQPQLDTLIWLSVADVNQDGLPDVTAVSEVRVGFANVSYLRWRCWDTDTTALFHPGQLLTLLF